jgi:hypothetical protein
LRTYVIDARGESIIHFSPVRTFIGDITSAVTGQPTLYAVDARWSSSSFAFFHQPVRRWRVRRCGNTVGKWPAHVSFAHRPRSEANACRSCTRFRSLLPGHGQRFADKSGLELLAVQVVAMLVGQTFASWNQIAGWLRRLEGLERAG